jgi:arabinose-5-phosphate isomerase
MLSAIPSNPISTNLQYLTDWAKETIIQEAAALNQLGNQLDESIARVVELILACEGRVILAGMGKSGQIGRKIASTLASTGTPSMFVHPAEASHGDLGMVERRDVVIAISKSGESPELADLLNYCRRFGIPVVGITADADSSLAKASNHLLLLPKIQEACPHGLAPTTSTTMVLALGDAIAIACLRARDFGISQFRDFHPGGKLGQRLTRVRDVMHGGDLLPTVPVGSTMSAAVAEMSRHRFGCVGILDYQGRLVGIFTDGDLRRHVSAANMDRSIEELMTTEPYRISPDALLADVACFFRERRIPSIFACLDDKPVGIIHLHDLIQKGLA